MIPYHNFVKSPGGNVPTQPGVSMPPPPPSIPRPMYYAQPSMTPVYPSYHAYPQNNIYNNNQPITHVYGQQNQFGWNNFQQFQPQNCLYNIPQVNSAISPFPYQQGSAQLGNQFNQFNSYKPKAVVSSGGQTYYCEPCDKEFSVKNQYDTHVSTHEPCSHPGCAFSASKKVVSAHYHSSHGLYSDKSGYKVIDVEGQSFSVLMGTSPTEVEEWRAQRRKKFPTSQNVTMKAEEMNKLQEVGGLCVENKRGQKRKKSDVVRKKPCMQHAKGLCLLGETCTLSHTFEDFPNLICRAFQRSNCRNGDTCKYIHFMLEKKSNNDTDGIANAITENKKTLRNNEKLEKAAKKPKKNELPKPLDGYDNRGTLLKSLLTSEMDKEENIILQCLRYIVKSNFFEKVVEVVEEVKEPIILPSLDEILNEDSTSDIDDNEEDSESECEDGEVLED